MKSPSDFLSTINRGFAGIDDEARLYHAVYLRSSFTIGRGVKRACAYISGLGRYELRINERKVGDHLLDPGETDYRHVALYSAFDVTPLLGAGENAAHQGYAYAQASGTFPPATGSFRL